MEESIAWFFDDRTGGDAVREDLFAKFGVKSLYKDVSIMEQEYVSNRCIIEASDYKGLNFRGVGWTGFVLAEPEFRAAGIVIPGADVYTALQTGVIDACELGNYFSNGIRGLHEVCKYAGCPGMHQFTQTHSTLINMKSWNSLPPDVQEIFVKLTAGRHARSDAFNLVECAKFMDDLEDYGNIFVRESPACQRTWRDVSWRYSDKLAAKSESYAEHWQDMKDHINFLSPYLDIQTPYMGKKITTIGVFIWSDGKEECLGGK